MTELFGESSRGKAVSLRRSLAALGVDSLRAAGSNAPRDENEPGRMGGPIGIHYRRLDGADGPLGGALSKNIRLVKGEIAFFKYGMLWTGKRPETVLYADALMPLMGRPLLVQTLPAPILTLVTSAHKVAGLKPQHKATDQDVIVLRDAIADRLFLNAVGEPITASTLIPLTGRVKVGGITYTLPRSQRDRIRNRQLYDIILRLPGGGGFYPPFERDPELVRQDVLNGYVSMLEARSAYGVWIEDGTYAIDWAKTAKLRSRQT